jgi:hypothetical protein
MVARGIGSGNEPLVSPELETLDQLQGGDLPLAVIRGLFIDQESFMRGIGGLLACGDVKLAHYGAEVPRHEWASLLATVGAKDGPTVSLTEQGAKRIA